MAVLERPCYERDHCPKAFQRLSVISFGQILSSKDIGCNWFRMEHASRVLCLRLAREVKIDLLNMMRKPSVNFLTHPSRSYLNNLRERVQRKVALNW